VSGASVVELKMEKGLVLQILFPVLLWHPAAGAPSNINDQNIPLIEAEGLKLNLEDFEGDPVFVQSIDHETSKTRYRLIQDNVTIERPTFERSVDDTGKEIIVMTPSNHKRSSRNIYVVLRRKSKDNQYYATYAYAR
jgi:hypothetical protein